MTKLSKSWTNQRCVSSLDSAFHLTSLSEPTRCNPLFQVVHHANASAWRTQQTDIRQGCPLLFEPCSFLQCIACLWTSTKDTMPLNSGNVPRHQLSRASTVFADDNLTRARSAHTASKYLRLVEEESDHFHMKLNKGKCCYVAFNALGPVKLKSGKHMESADTAMYLGAQVSKTVNPKTRDQATHLRQ